MCTSLIDIAQKYSPPLVEEATALCVKYKRALSLFSHCHNVYNKNRITEQEKSALGMFRTCTNTLVVDFFTADSIQGILLTMLRTVKKHILEMQISEWMSYIQ